MKKTIEAICAILAATLIQACGQMPTETGVSQNLATFRAGTIDCIEYSLHFDLTKGSSADIPATENLTFTIKKKTDILLDFKASQGSIKAITINGQDKSNTETENEHILLPAALLKNGKNTVAISFNAGTQSLNRRENLMYTLLVPDRARTLFPCFDQPDLKAIFNLSLSVPEGWIAISNTSASETHGNLVRFEPTEPLSTYLFSFVAGVFQSTSEERNGRKVTMYHRETDEAKKTQCKEILSQVFKALDWMETWTGITYPFAKYDFVVIPDFQYGGMEHTGATLYNDKRIFLGEKPTTDELLNRSSLIAHETAHMWFGDFVTMKWFNDVWTKEVFANWFAKQMVQPLFPEVNHILNDIKTLYVPAYSEDRTEGSNAIQRALGNLQDAGLIYGNIIYDKAPVMMDKLYVLMGEESFRTGIREYLRKYAYGNATWDDLVEILDTYTEADLKEWSRVWVKEKGMPIYCADVSDGTLHLSQMDPFGNGNIWQQEVSGEIAEGRYWIPNPDGKAYGAFLPDAGSLKYIMDNWGTFSETARMSLLVTLYENELRGSISPETFLLWASKEMPDESNALILSSLISFGASVLDDCDATYHPFEEALKKMAEEATRNHEARLMAFRQLYSCASDADIRNTLRTMWENEKAYGGLTVGESDWTALAYRLMMWFPEEAGRIAETQRYRIDNPDRRETFNYVCQAVSPNPQERKAFFDSLFVSSDNRRPESRVLTALGLLCDPLRGNERLQYIVPTLEHLEEIQRTGDIFFPASWCRTVLGRQRSEDARSVTDNWLETHKDMNPLLATKVRQAIFSFFRFANFTSPSGKGRCDDGRGQR